MAENGQRRAEGHHTNCDQRWYDGERWSHPVECFPDVGGGKILFEEKFQAVRDGLDEAEKVEVFFKS